MATLYTRKGKNGKLFYYVNYVVDGDREHLSILRFTFEDLQKTKKSA